ncbi:MAG: adenosine deaminase [Acidobacteria bacterium]|nr:adenosine deaminase [Acidobacteriota bacterium]
MDFTFPKAELHLHLEGSIEPETLRELARRHSLPAAEFSHAELAKAYRYNDFLGFLRAFKWVTDHLQTPEDYELAASRLLQKLHAQNVRYAEIYYSAGICLWKNQEVEPILEALEEARRKAEGSCGIQAQWIFDAVRQFGAEAAEKVVELAIRFQDRHVVGIGLGGDEARGAPHLFRSAYEAARAEGLRLTAHAGETTGPESIWGALDQLGAERIGHGVSALRDHALVERLREQQIPVEVCVTSNYATGAVAAGEEHPVRRLFDAGLLVVINSDDPPMFHTTINNEYARLAEHHGFAEAELRTLARNSFRAAFLPEDAKAAFLAN